MLVKGGGAEEASKTRVRCTLVNFNELFPIFTLGEASLGLKMKISSFAFKSCWCMAVRVLP